MKFIYIIMKVQYTVAQNVPNAAYILESWVALKILESNAIPHRGKPCLNSSYSDVQVMKNHQCESAAESRRPAPGQPRVRGEWLNLSLSSSTEADGNGTNYNI